MGAGAWGEGSSGDQESESKQVVSGRSVPSRDAPEQPLPRNPDLHVLRGALAAAFSRQLRRQVAVVDIASLAILKGDLPGRALGLVVEWGRLHRGELEANWTRAREAQPLLPVEPLG